MLQGPPQNLWNHLPNHLLHLQRGIPGYTWSLSAKELALDRETKGKQHLLSSCKEHSGHKDVPNICIQLCQPLPATHMAQGLCR